MLSPAIFSKKYPCGEMLTATNGLQNRVLTKIDKKNIIFFKNKTFKILSHCDLVAIEIIQKCNLVATYKYFVIMSS